VAWVVEVVRPQVESMGSGVLTKSMLFGCGRRDEAETDCCMATG
jgi:hypothetical protein